MNNILDETNSLNAQDFQTLVTGSTYIVGFSVTSKEKSDNADFDGGDNWIFDRYKISITHQFLPSSDQEGKWTNTVLSLPGYKEGKERPIEVSVGSRYIAFYKISAMADGYSLEGLTEWSQSKEKAISDIIQQI